MIVGLILSQLPCLDMGSDSETEGETVNDIKEWERTIHKAINVAVSALKGEKGCRLIANRTISFHQLKDFPNFTEIKDCVVDEYIWKYWKKKKNNYQWMLVSTKLQARKTMAQLPLLENFTPHWNEFMKISGCKSIPVQCPYFKVYIQSPIQVVRSNFSHKIIIIMCIIISPWICVQSESSFAG